METIILSGKSIQKAKLLIDVAKELGFNGKQLTEEEVEDMGLVIAMKKGRTGKYIDTEKFLKTLEK